MQTTASTVYESLYAFAGSLDVIDTHEHLPPEEQRTGKPVDFFTLFSHYCVGDLVTAGLPQAELGILQDPAGDPEHKWAVFAPYYRLIKSGSYARAARIAMERFYGLSDLTGPADALTVTERMRRENTPGIYRRMLAEACRIKASFLFTNDAFPSEFFYFVDCVDHLTHLNSFTQLLAASAEMGGRHATLGQYVDALGDFLRRKAERGVKGIKFTSAYYRSLDFASVSEAEAGRVFAQLSSAPHMFNFPSDHSVDVGQALLLQDYLTHRVLDFCGQLGLPAVFHTGLQAGNRNNPHNARPEPLWHLFFRYPNVKFLLLHGGLPWTLETAMLAKSYPNVTIDMAWMHIISPELAVNALKVWVDMLPMNKITGFGGDYLVPEKVFGHLTMAKENICRALSDKVLDGSLREDDACAWLEHLLHRNAAGFYGV